MKIEEMNRANNFRDLGGYQAFNGKVIKKGLIVRGGSLDHLTDEELQAVKSFGFHTVLDFRDNHEVAMGQDPKIDGAQYLHIPVIPDDMDTINFAKETLENRISEDILASEESENIVEKLYRRMPFGSAAYQAMFDELQAEHVPILIHGSAGKDRTGIAAMLILLALGASEETIIDDYMKTNDYRKYVIEHFMYKFHLLIEQDTDAPKKMIWAPGVDRKNILASLDEIHKHYASSEEFLHKEYHQSADKLERLRNLYLE